MQCCPMSIRTSRRKMSDILDSVLNYTGVTLVSKSCPGKDILKIVLLLSGEDLFKNKSYSTLQLVQIYIKTATFDDIERDKKIKTEAQLSLIGGTMGLLTGFSIISGVEIIFFLFRSKLCQILELPSLFPGWSARSGLPRRQSFRTI